jgi:hypothetical protein
MKPTPVKAGGRTVALSYSRKSGEPAVYFRADALEGLPASVLEQFDSRPTNGVYSERWLGTEAGLKKVLERVDKNAKASS